MSMASFLIRCYFLISFRIAEFVEVIHSIGGAAYSLLILMLSWMYGSCSLTHVTNISHSNEIFIFLTHLRLRLRLRHMSYVQSMNKQCSLYSVLIVYAIIWYSALLSWERRERCSAYTVTRAIYCSGIFFANHRRQCRGKRRSAPSSFCQWTENTILYFIPWQENGWKAFMFMFVYLTQLDLERKIYI